MLSFLRPNPAAGQTTIVLQNCPELMRRVKCCKMRFLTLLRVVESDEIGLNPFFYRKMKKPKKEVAN